MILLLVTHCIFSFVQFSTICHWHINLLTCAEGAVIVNVYIQSSEQQGENSTTLTPNPAVHDTIKYHDTFHDTYRDVKALLLPNIISS